MAQYSSQDRLTKFDKLVESEDENYAYELLAFSTLVFPAFHSLY